MSFIAPNTSGQADLNKILDTAIKLINKGDKKFPLLSDKPGYTHPGFYLAMEAKNILIAALMTGNWSKLAQKFPSVVPKPAEQEPGWRLSQDWVQWPDAASTEGLAGAAIDQQADTLADVAFTRLMVSETLCLSSLEPDLIDHPNACNFRFATSPLTLFALRPLVDFIRALHSRFILLMSIFQLT